jgi:hypothetical protein
MAHCSRNSVALPKSKFDCEFAPCRRFSRASRAGTKPLLSSCDKLRPELEKSKFTAEFLATKNLGSAIEPGSQSYRHQCRQDLVVVNKIALRRSMRKTRRITINTIL